MDIQNPIPIRSDFEKTVISKGLIPLNISYESISSKVILNLPSINDFLMYVESSQSNYIYYYYLFYNSEEYLIPEDWYDDQSYNFQHEVKKHNKKINSLDFEKPVSLFIFILQNGVSVGMRLDDPWLELEEIENAEETMESLETMFYSEFKQIEESKKTKQKIDEDKLRKLIFNDPEFKYCKNQDLRYYYLVDLLEKNNDLIELYGYIFKPFGTPRYGNAKLFMDKTWMIYQEQKKLK